MAMSYSECDNQSLNQSDFVYVALFIHKDRNTTKESIHSEGTREKRMHSEIIKVNE